MYRINLRVSEGINFPYYVLGKAQLAISPFTEPWVWMDPRSDPYALFTQEYGIVEQVDLGDMGDVWYDWLSKTIHNCPECAVDSLRYCGSQLLPIAQGLLPEYLSRWPGIREKLVKLLREAVPEPDLPSVLQRNERLFGLSYPEDGQEIIYFDLFPTVAQQKPGSHLVFGLGCLHRPGQLLSQIESEVGLTLLERIFECERVRQSFRRVKAITNEDRYVRGRGSLLEALNNVIRAIERRGGAVILDDIPRKPGERGYWQIVESLFGHRNLWKEKGLYDFIIISLEAIDTKTDG